MKVLELIQILQNMPPDALVLIDSYEEGQEELEEVNGVKVILNHNRENQYQGPHEVRYPDDSREINAVYLKRQTG